MSCLVCFTDYTEIQNLYLPCGCNSCSNCFTSWAIEQIKGFAYQVNNSIKCMNGCGKDFHIDQVIDKLNNSQRELINEALLDSYLKKSQDVRVCPGDGCNYAGVIDLDKKCSDNLECMKCGHQWSDKTQTTSKKSAVSIVRGISKFGELKSELWQVLFTKSCTKCHMNIQKNGGCKHMTCARCKHEFCWECGQNWHSHSHSVCKRVIMTKFLIIAFFALNILYLLGILQYVFMVLGWIYFLLCFAFKCAFFSLALKTAYDVNSIIQRKSKQGYMRIVAISFIIYFYGYLFKFLCVLLLSVCVNWALRQTRGSWRRMWNNSQQFVIKANKYRESFMKLSSYA